MMDRLSVRLHELKAARNAHIDEPTGRTGKDLAIIKSQEVELAFAALKLDLKDGPPRSKTNEQTAGNAYSRGQQAAESVQITTGIRYDDKPRLTY
jgi:hypothetical protein